MDVGTPASGPPVEAGVAGDPRDDDRPDQSGPEVSVILVLGVDGLVLTDTLNPPVTRPDLSDRDYYRDFATSDDHGAFVSAPVKGYRTGQWSVVVARRISGPHGEFAGVVAATVTLAFLEDFYRNRDAGRLGGHRTPRDGTILLRYPAIGEQIGHTLPADTPWYRLVGLGAGSFRSPGYISRIPQLVAIQPMRDFPLVVDTSTKEAEALAGWRREACWLLAGAAVLAHIGGFIAAGFGAQLGRLEKSEASLALRNIQLETGQVQFNAVLDNMCQGVVFYDNDERLVVCNRRYLEMYRLSADAVRQGTSRWISSTCGSRGNRRDDDGGCLCKPPRFNA